MSTVDGITARSRSYSSADSAGERRTLLRLCASDTDNTKTSCVAPAATASRPYLSLGTSTCGRTSGKRRQAARISAVSRICGSALGLTKEPISIRRSPAATKNADPGRRQIRHRRRMIGQVAQPSDRLTDDAEGGAVAVDAVLPVAGDLRDHETGSDCLQLLAAEPHLRELAWPEVLDEHIAPLHKVKHQLDGARFLRFSVMTRLLRACIDHHGAPAPST